MGKFIDLMGQTFGKLTVLRRAKNDRWRKAMYVCRCSCGKEKTILAGSLRGGMTKSCGCLAVENIRKLHKGKHGDAARSGVSPEYRSWAAMKDRCFNQANKAWQNYGGRGIKVCDRWLNSYENFLADMGRKPTSKHSLDRINVDGPYSTDNCRWATMDIQIANRRKVARIEKFTTEEIHAELRRRLEL